MKKIVIIIGLMVFFFAGCSIMPATRGSFQNLDERVATLEGIVGENITQISKVESHVGSYNKAIANLRAKINSCSKRAGQLEDQVGYASPEVYAFWARGFASGSSTLPEKMKAQLDTLASVIKKENILIKKIVGYSDRAGNTKANEALSMRRAEAVKIYLVIAKGLNLADVKILSGGETSRYGSRSDNRCVAIISKRNTTTP